MGQETSLVAYGPARGSIFTTLALFFESLPFLSDPRRVSRFPAITTEKQKIKKERMKMNARINDETGYAPRRWVRGTNLYHLLQQLL